MIELVAAVHDLMRGPVEVVLRRSKALIADPARWTKGAYARDANGDNTPTRGGNAVCWCSVGATLAHTADAEIQGASRGVLYAVVTEMAPGFTVGGFNDAPERTHPEVLAMFDRAIALAKERGL